MDYNRILQGILDIGESMLKSGAENYRLEDSLYRMCKSYGFKRYDVFAIPSNIQITVETPDGEIITQIRHIESLSTDFDRLNYLNDLSRYVCQNQPDERELRERYLEVLNRPQQHPALKYIASIMIGAGFSVFFGADAGGVLIAAAAALMIAVVGNWLGKRESNQMVYNLILSFLAEIMIICGVRMGIGSRPECITIGMVMLLISGLSTTNGIRELIQRDYISGAVHIMNSILGATGIACGTAFAMLLLDAVSMEKFVVNPSVFVQLISGTVGCVGCAVSFRIRGKQVLYSGIGAFSTWAIYVLAFGVRPDNFFATLVGAVFVAFYAYIMARINKAPSTIFLTASMFPLIPGPSLYYMMYGSISGNMGMAYNEMVVLVSTCLAITFGFNIVNIATRFFTQSNIKA